MTRIVCDALDCAFVLLMATGGAVAATLIAHAIPRLEQLLFVYEPAVIIGATLGAAAGAALIRRNPT